MRVLIEGNMASGKSLYARAFAANLGVPHISMDKYRTEAWHNGAGTGHDREHMARHFMLGAIKKNESFVMERTGTGEFDKAVLSELDRSAIPYQRILINTKATTCVSRTENRGAQRSYPLPDWMGDTESFIYRTDVKLKVLKESDVYFAVIPNTRYKAMEEINEQVETLSGVLSRKMESKVVMRDGARV